MRPKTVVMLALAFSSLQLQSFAADKKQLTAAVAAVDANLKTPAGKEYEAALGRDIQKHIAVIKPCRQVESTPADFDIFVRLKSDGKVDDVLVYPETPYANCARKALFSDSFSPPPHGDYWVNIHMQFKR